jgi:cell division protein ZapA (FtsZ GTPase activity inhibitor)
MSKKNVVNVTIQGLEYTLRTETSPDHTRAIAEYVDHVIGETMESGARIESHLAALRIAGELFESRARGDMLAEEMTALSEEIKPWLPPAKRNS